MSDQILKYGGDGAAPYGDPFVVRDSWPGWLKDTWINTLASSGYAPQKAPWVPKYDVNSISWPTNDGAMKTIEMEPWEFPTMETAMELAARYAINGKPLTVLEIPFVGGPVSSLAVQRLLLFPNGNTLPAYQLANYYTFNPEDKNNAADHLCRLLIARVWPGAGQQMTPA